MSLASKIPMVTGIFGRIGAALSMSPMRCCRPGRPSWKTSPCRCVQTRMVYTVNTAVADVLATLARQPRVGSLDLEFSSAGMRTTIARKGYFEIGWGAPASWDDVILQGPHLYVATPMYKSLNPTMKNKQDWSATDFETLPADAIPVTAYKPAGDRGRYDANYTHGSPDPRAHALPHCLARMAANTGRTNSDPCIDPAWRGPRDGVSSAAFRRQTANLCAMCGVPEFANRRTSLCARAKVRHIRSATINRLPIADRASAGKRRCLCASCGLTVLPMLTPTFGTMFTSEAFATDDGQADRSAPTARSLGDSRAGVDARHPAAHRRRSPPSAGRDRRPRRAHAWRHRRPAVHHLPHPVPSPLRLRPQGLCLRRQWPSRAERGAHRLAQERRPDHRRRADRHQPGRATPTSTSCRSASSTGKPTCGPRTPSSSGGWRAL